MIDKKKKAPAAEPNKEGLSDFEEYLVSVRSSLFSVSGSFTVEIMKTIDSLMGQLAAKQNQGLQMVEEIARLHRILNEKNIPFEQKNLKK